jgi:putative FmdB family regulatory protein
MPRYDFVCPKCECHEEHNVSVDQRDTAKPPCPKCKTPMERRFSYPMATIWAGKFQGRSIKKTDYDGLGSDW